MNRNKEAMKAISTLVDEQGTTEEQIQFTVFMVEIATLGILMKKGIVSLKQCKEIADEIMLEARS